MDQVIAGTYQLEREIGSGGGGVVYLARHLRLDKQVVVKIDKRRAGTAKQETLRQEVDALKNLSHTCIPQVYDYIIKDDEACTIIDYIEGESLDKSLARGERASQAQIIQWACELLDALCYLHSRPPYGILHGDIKPANIMVTPQGEARLIDFNIALALGEEGAVQVGYSRGYASPEHYGIDYRCSTANTASSTVDPSSEETEAVDSTEVTVFSGTSHSGVSRSGSTTKMSKVKLDVRSDIYSLGATLYHLLSGMRPPQDAETVVPLSSGVGVSPAVAAIIQKAMQLNPEVRYQSAQEMLTAFQHLYEDDERSRRLRRSKKITAAALSVLFLLGGGTSFAGQRVLRQMEEQGRLIAEAERETTQTAKDALENIGKSQESLVIGDKPAALTYAVQALEKDTIYNPQAQKALTDALGVYDLADGLKNHIAIQLPSEAIKVVLSPEGGKAALFYAYRIQVVDTATGEQLAELPTRSTAAIDFYFLDEDTLLFPGENGLTAYRVSEAQTLWAGQAATRLACSDDGQFVVGVDGSAPQAVVYRCADGSETATIPFGERGQSVPAGGGILADSEDSLLKLNADGSLLAVSFEDGSLSLFDRDGGERPILERSSYFHFEGGFSGQYFAYAAWDAENCVFAIVDTQTMRETIMAVSVEPFRVKTDSDGIYLAQGGVVVKIDPITGEQTEAAYLPGEVETFVRSEAGDILASTKTSSYALFDPNGMPMTSAVREKGCEELALAGPYAVLASRETPIVQILKKVSHPESLLASYDPAWGHSEARLSADGETLMLFQYDRFYLLSKEGELLSQVELPDASEIYDQQLRREGNDSWLEVFYRDGTVTAWSAKDGSLLWERKESPYQGDLEERFTTSRWEIRAPLHETPVVYNRETGAVVRELEKDSYLTYVTEVGNYIITQYLSGQGEPYGLLLDQNCNTLAYLPDLCDVTNEILVFDDGMGNLRQSRIYSLPELLALADKQTGGIKTQ